MSYVCKRTNSIKLYGADNYAANLGRISVEKAALASHGKLRDARSELRATYESKPYSPNSCENPCFESWRKIPFCDRQISQNQISPGSYFGNLKGKLKKAYYSAQYMHDLLTGAYFNALNAGGTRIGEAIYDIGGKMAGLRRQRREENTLYGDLWKRKPIIPCRFTDYVKAKEQGGNPSEWFAHAGDLDYFQNYNPKSELGCLANGTFQAFLDYFTPVTLAEAAALNAANALAAKPFAKQWLPYAFGAVEQWEDTVNRILQYR